MRDSNNVKPLIFAVVEVDEILVKASMCVLQEAML